MIDQVPHLAKSTEQGNLHGSKEKICSNFCQILCKYILLTNPNNEYIFLRYVAVLQFEFPGRCDV